MVIFMFFHNLTTEITLKIRQGWKSPKLRMWSELSKITVSQVNLFVTRMKCVELKYLLLPRSFSTFKIFHYRSSYFMINLSVFWFCLFLFLLSVCFYFYNARRCVLIKTKKQFQTQTQSWLSFAQLKCMTNYKPAF